MNFIISRSNEIFLELITFGWRVKFCCAKEYHRSVLFSPLLPLSPLAATMDQRGDTRHKTYHAKSRELLRCADDLHRNSNGDYISLI